MASAGTLIFQLAADVSQLRTDMQKAQGTISESLKSIQESTLAEAVMTGMEYATEFAKGFAEKIAQAIEQADAMGKMAQKIGASTEALSGLAYAGQFAGVQMDDLALGFKGLEKSLLDARDPLSNSAAAFRALGLNVKDLQAENPADAFKDIATAFSKFQDGAQKAAVATEVFGKQGVNLIPLLNQGAAGLNAATAEAEKLGLVISQDTADAMGELSDNMHRMSVMSEGAAAQLAQQLEPAFEFVIDVMRDFSTEGTALNSTLKVVAETIRSFIAVVYGLGTAVGSAGQFLVALDGAMTKLVTGQISMKDAGEQIGAAWQKGAGQIADANTKIDRLMGTHQQSLEERVAGEDAAWGKVAQRAASTGKAVLDYTGQLDANAEAHRKATEKVSDYERMLESLSEQLRKAAANGDVMQELMTDPKFAKMTKDQQQNLMDLTTAYVRLTAAQKQQTDQKQAEQKVIDEADKAWVQHIETLREYAKTVKDAIDPTQ
ncbi:hypothetical protein, partial [Paraburkholderia sp.]|uniref:hypothetical protein n=1 Tax=Paraburkholderia sp. TaxID=1926495 RepID=UPI002F41C5EE